MKDWKKTLVPPSATVRDTIRSISDGLLQIALVVDDVGRLVGTVTDGDIRSAILRGVPLEAEVSAVMHRQPIVAKPGDAREAILASLKLHQIHHMPIVDAGGRLVGLETIDGLLKPTPRDNVVVLMAGGLGTRLRPLTDEQPKPMLHVGNRPILERIILSFVEHGFSRFLVAVNYKADVVMDHFGDGARWGVSIGYLREKRRLGTAGALGLIDEAPRETFLVMNADLLTQVNFAALLEYHARLRAAATMCVREYDYQVPFGVVTLDEHRLVAIEEKPVKKCFVNAGIYAFEPQVLELVPRGVPCDMPQLFERLLQRRREVAAFPVREYWLDIGRFDDYQRAESDYGEEA